MRPSPEECAAARPEFDTYSEGYAAGTTDTLTRWIGGSVWQLLGVKTQWLLRDLARHPAVPVPGQPVMLLDFGCGTGEFLQLLRRGGFTGHLEGCDASEGMLRQAAARWQAGSLPRLHVAGLNAALPFADASYDLVVACCVFHHISPGRRRPIGGELARILRPSGRLVVFEHNPLHPVTRLMVRRAPIDRHAVLLTPSDLRRIMESSGMREVRRAYLMFFPPRFRGLSRMEPMLGHLPLGGQYAGVYAKQAPGA